MQIEESVYRDAGAAVPVSVRGRIVTILTRQPRMRVIVQVTKPPGTTYASRVGAVESSRFSHRETLGGGRPLNSLFQESNGFAVAFATSYLPPSLAGSREAGAAVPVSVRGRKVTRLTRQPRRRDIVQATKPPGTTDASRGGADESILITGCG